jgi:phenylalanyl-tRNA synthetase beta chain
MLVIADAEKPVALAGIMGGGNSEIDDQTTTVLLESATFDPSNIRATCNTLSIHSDSSYRYERGVDIEMAEKASARAAQLLCQYAGGTLVSGMLDSNPNPYTPHQVNCRFSKVNEVLGVDVSKTKVLDIFRRLELPVVAENDASCTVEIPSFRLDLTREIDLIEEVSRIFGLNNIPASPISARSGGPIKNDSYYPIQALREQLLGLGLSECYNYSMMNKELALKSTGFEESELISLSNPLSSELSVMRPTLLPGMMTVITHNIAHANHNLELFELGRVISSRANQPEEHYEICIAMTGLEHPERFSSEKKEVRDFYSLKGVVEGLLEARRVSNFKFDAKDHPFFEIGQSASLTVNGKIVGFLGQVNDEVVGKTRNNHPIFMAILNADMLLAVNGKKKIFEELPSTPATSRDISFIADQSLSHAEVIGAIKTAKVKTLENVDLIDIYVDDKAKEEGKKSMTYSFTYRHPTATLTVDEGNQMHEKIITALKKRLAIEIR